MASASASVVPPLIPLQKRRIRGISGVSSTESASSTDFPGAPVFDADTDRQADSVVKDEADLQEDLALADSLNTALPGRHEDDEEIAATQQDGEEDEADEGEEEEEQEEEEEEEEEEEVAPRQAQVAPPPQEGVVDQGDVISQCLASQARARRHVYKGVRALPAAVIASVLLLVLISRPARRCRFTHPHSYPCPLRPHHSRSSVRQHDASLMARCMCVFPWTCVMNVAGMQGRLGLWTGGIRQTGFATSLSPNLPRACCQSEMFPAGIRQTRLAISSPPLS